MVRPPTEFRQTNRSRFRLQVGYAEQDAAADDLVVQVAEPSRQLSYSPILELRDLVKRFPYHRAVNGISLKIPRGGFYSLLKSPA
jgi:hypothetical protein